MPINTESYLLPDQCISHQESYTVWCDSSRPNDCTMDDDWLAVTSFDAQFKSIFG